MLEINVHATELWNEKNETFIFIKEQTLMLEHSLVSLSKWESKWNKAFLSKRTKTVEETLDYIKCMTLNKKVDPNVYYALSSENIELINEYIDAPMTATKFYEDENKKNNNETITSELVYYWMIASNIPFECQKWHINRLLTLIRVCSMKNNPKSMSKSEIMKQNKALNEARKQKFHTKG